MSAAAFMTALSRKINKAKASGADASFLIKRQQAFFQSLKSRRGGE